MTTMAPVPEDTPLMVAWKSYCASEDYANSFKWAAQEKHREGSMWAAFMAGFTAASAPHAEPAPRPDESGIDWHKAEVTSGADYYHPETRRFALYAVQARPYISHLEAELEESRRQVKSALGMYRRCREREMQLAAEVARLRASLRSERIVSDARARHFHALSAQARKACRVLDEPPPSPPEAEVKARECEHEWEDAVVDEYCGRCGTRRPLGWDPEEKDDAAPTAHRPRYRVDNSDPNRTVVTWENKPEGLPVAEPVASAPTAPAGDEEKWQAFEAAVIERSVVVVRGGEPMINADEARAIAREHLEPKHPRVTEAQAIAEYAKHGIMGCTAFVRALRSLGLLDAKEGA